MKRHNSEHLILLNDHDDHDDHDDDNDNKSENKELEERPFKKTNNNEKTVSTSQSLNSITEELQRKSIEYGNESISELISQLCYYIEKDIKQPQSDTDKIKIHAQNIIEICERKIELLNQDSYSFVIIDTIEGINQLINYIINSEIVINIKGDKRKVFDAYTEYIDTNKYKVFIQWNKHLKLSFK
jgi:hypothetical protein